MNDLQNTCLLSGAEGYLDQLYEMYLRDPHSVEAQWRDYFQSFPVGQGPELSHQAIQQYF